MAVTQSPVESAGDAADTERERESPVLLEMGK